MASLQPVRVASIECPSCKADIDVWAHMEAVTSPGTRLDKHQLTLRMAGLVVTHDCRPKPKSKP